MSRPPAGPGETHAWPDHLTARVVDPAGRHLHGYDAEADLARHYRFGEVALLALTGEPPGAAAGAAFDAVAAFLAPVPPGDAPPHAAGLARLMGGRAASVVATAALALAEATAALIAAHAPLLAWLDAPEGPLPPAFRDAAGADAPAVARLRDALAPTGLPVPALDEAPTRDAALLAALHACGLRRPEAIEAAVTLARLPAVAAEAFAVPPLGFAGYPLNLPPWRYVEEGGDAG